MPDSAPDSVPQKVRITATDIAFGGRSFIKLVIPGGPTRSFTPDKATVEAVLTEEQVKSVMDTGLYEVEAVKQTAKAKSASGSKSTSTTASPTDSPDTATSKE